MLQILQSIYCGGVSRLKHLAGRQVNCSPCLKAPDNVKVKVIELLKRADAKKQGKAADFQVLIEDVHIGEDEYDFEDPNDCSSQKIRIRLHQDKMTDE